MLHSLKRLQCVYSVWGLLIIFMVSLVVYIPNTLRKCCKSPAVVAPLRDEWGFLRNKLRVTEQSWIDCMTNGLWVPDPQIYSKSLETRLNAFFRKTRDLYHMPTPLQRKDNKCGSITLGRGLEWFRAVCDPFQSTPCCFKHICKNISMQECSCPDCYDLRQTLHGELSKWVGHQNTCPIKNFTSNEACEILRGRTLVFIGDSFMRQMFMGTQILLTNNDVDSCVRKMVSKDQRAHCQWMFMFTRECRFFIPKKDVLCDGTVTIHRHITGSNCNLVDVIRQYQNLPKTTFIVGVGLHYSLSTSNVIKQVALPIFGELEKMGGVVHQVYWMLPHYLGLLKTPTVPGQSNPKLVKFNREMRKYLSGKGVIMVNAFNLTKNLASYDGSHYPKASNILKVQILLNHIVHEDNALIASVQNYTQQP